MSIEQLLFATDVKHWRTRQAVVFDWYDGPRQGVCALAIPECEFVFDLVSERYNPDGLDDRLFRVREIQKGDLERILCMISSLGDPEHRVWTPVWRFRTLNEQASAEVAIKDILKSSRETHILIRTHDMLTFLGCWDAIEIPQEGQDLFDHLEI